MAASPKARAASTASSAVNVTGQGPAAATLAAPRNSTATRTVNRRATSATPSYHTVSPDTYSPAAGASAGETTNPMTGPRSASAGPCRAGVAVTRTAPPPGTGTSVA